MRQSTTNLSAREWFSEYTTLAYWIARKWTRGINACRGVFLSYEEWEEVSQDTVCNGWDRFAKRCENGLPSDKDEAKAWIAQCCLYAARDAVDARSTFGRVSSRYAIRDDCWQRRERVAGDLEREESKPETESCDDAKLRAFVDRELAELSPKLRDTAYGLALGHKQTAIANDLGITTATVRNRRQAIRDYLAA